MGFFSKIFNNGKELSKIASAVVDVKNELQNNQYRTEVSQHSIETAAWVCRLGVIEVIEKNKWPYYYSLYVKLDGRNIKMTIQEAYKLTVNKVREEADKQDDDLKQIINAIIDNGASLALQPNPFMQDILKKYSL